MKTPTKEQLLLAADTKAIAQTLANCWSTLHNEEQKELCLEQIYEQIEATAPYPPEFTMHSKEKKAQYEMDIDMEIITITFKDISELLFQNEETSQYFWDLVGNKESKENQKRIKALLL